MLGEASNFAETISMTAALKPDVILLDVHMPDDRSFKPEFVKASLCRARVLAMSVPSDCKSDEETRLLAENFGAVRVLDKAKLSDELIPAILQRRLKPVISAYRPNHFAGTWPCDRNAGIQT